MWKLSTVGTDYRLTLISSLGFVLDGSVHVSWLSCPSVSVSNKIRSFKHLPNNKSLSVDPVSCYLRYLFRFDILSHSLES